MTNDLSKKPNVEDKKGFSQTPVDATKKRAEVSPDIDKDRQEETKEAKTELGANVAEGLTEEGVPKHTEIGKLYYFVKEEGKKNPDLKGPILNGLLALLAMTAKFESKFGGLFGSLFGSDFFDSVTGDAAFSDDEKKSIFDSWFEAPAEMEKEKIEELKKLSIEEASVKYVSSLLGVEELGSAKSLTERLKNMENADKKCYSQVKKLENLKDMGEIPKGTVIFFLGSLPKEDFSAAYATGNGFEFTYFDIKDGPKTFDLKEDNSPIKSTIIQFKGALLPKTAKIKPAVKKKPASETAATDKPAVTDKNPADKTTPKTQ